MSGDEGFVFIAGAIIGGIGWAIWFWPLASVHRVVGRVRHRLAMAAVAVVCTLALLAVLRWLAADDVRNDLRYLFMYQFIGAAWVAVARGALPLLGYSARDDVLERRNGAAGWVVAGSLLALTLCFAGGNIGNGPGWWVVVFSAALATAGLFGLWTVYEWALRPGEAITIGRDTAAGLRLAGLLVAWGMILGAAVAGDWVSIAATVRDFGLRAWPALVLLAIAAALEKLWPMRVERDLLSALLWGAFPAFVYLVGAVAWLSLARIWA